MTRFLTELELMEFAIKQMNLNCVFLANHLSYDNQDDIDTTQFIKKKILKFCDDHPDQADHVTIMDAFWYDGIVTFDSQELAREFFSIFNDHKETYSSGAYASLYLDGNSVDENT